MNGGYTGKILHVDLSTQIVRAEPLDESLAMQFIGGRGIGTRLLWDMTKPGAAPLGEDAPIMFLIGPLTGLAPAGAHTCVVFKSPATGRLAHTVTGANWGPELKFAGYDGIIIHGKAQNPVYLHLSDDSVEIRDASTLWGMGTIATEIQLKKELKDPLYRVLSIGPAGENQVKYASIQQEHARSAARCGGGCVMGSKNLKAIAVHGTKSVPVAQPREFYPARLRVESKILGAKNRRWVYSITRWGSALGFSGHDYGEMDVKNYREASWDKAYEVGRFSFERRCRVKRRGCFSCPTSCMQLGVIPEGKYAGYFASPDYDSTGTIGPGCLVANTYGIVYLNRLGDDLGFDNVSVGNVTGFIMECYEKGLLTKKDLDGIDLKWGNLPAIVELWHKIAMREGIGELLSQGVKKVSEVVGKGSEKFAMQVKGLEFGGATPQAHHDRGLQYAIGDRGGCHHYGMTIEEQNARAWVDSLTVCSWHRSLVDPPEYLELLNSATGLTFAESDWAPVAERILLLGRAYNIREGMKPLEDDVLPERVHSEPLTIGPKAGSYYPREKFLKDREEWYKERGCNETGIPTEKKLRELKLDFVVPELRC